jgi:prepilin-type N-terminal cleavage/methylation domain-containing protein
MRLLSSGFVNGCKRKMEIYPGIRPATFAFTLIELLLVIAVIAILAGVLLPALSKAKQKGVAIKCLNNTRQLAIAAHLYTLDNNELWPQNGLSDLMINLANPPANYAPRLWAEGRTFDRLNNEQEARASVSARLSQTAKYIPTKDTFRCPADRGLLGPRNNQFQRPRSYGQNWFIGWTQDRATIGGAYTEPGLRNQIFIKTVNVKKPSDIFLYSEVHRFSFCGPPFGTHPRWDFQGNPTGQNLSYNVPGQFHGRTTFFSYADGHAQGRKWISPNFNNPMVMNRPLPENDGTWHNHVVPLPGVTSTEVKMDFSWLALRATEPIL